MGPRRWSPPLRWPVPPFAYRPLRVVFRADAALHRPAAPWGFSLFGQRPLTPSAALPPLPRPTGAAECKSGPGPSPVPRSARPSPIVSGYRALPPARHAGQTGGTTVRQCVAMRHAGGGVTGVNGPITAAMLLTVIGVAQSQLARAPTDAWACDGDCLGGAARTGYNSVGCIAFGPTRIDRCSPLSAGTVATRPPDTASAGGCVPRPRIQDATRASVEARHAPGVASHRLWWRRHSSCPRLLPGLAEVQLPPPRPLLIDAASRIVRSRQPSFGRVQRVTGRARRQRSRPRSRDTSPAVHAAGCVARGRLRSTYKGGPGGRRVPCAAGRAGARLARSADGAGARCFRSGLASATQNGTDGAHGTA